MGDPIAEDPREEGIDEAVAPGEGVAEEVEHAEDEHDHEGHDHEHDHEVADMHNQTVHDELNVTDHDEHDHEDHDGHDHGEEPAAAAKSGATNSRAFEGRVFTTLFFGLA